MPTPPSRTPFAGMLRGVVLAGTIGTLVIATIGWALRDERGGLSALLGAGLAFVVILIGLLAMRLVISGDAGATMAGAFVVYIGQLVVLAAAIGLLSGRDWLDGPAFAAAAIAGTILLQVGQISGYVRSRHVLYPNGGQA